MCICAILCSPSFTLKRTAHSILSIATRSLIYLVYAALICSTIAMIWQPRCRGSSSFSFFLCNLMKRLENADSFLCVFLPNELKMSSHTERDNNIEQRKGAFLTFALTTRCAMFANLCVRSYFQFGPQLFSSSVLPFQSIFPLECFLFCFSLLIHWSLIIFGYLKVSIGKRGSGRTNALPNTRILCYYSFHVAWPYSEW